MNTLWRAFNRDTAGCLPGCDWPRDRCVCPPLTLSERGIILALRLLRAILIGIVLGVFALGLWTLFR